LGGKIEYEKGGQARFRDLRSLCKEVGEDPTATKKGQEIVVTDKAVQEKTREGIPRTVPRSLPNSHRRNNWSAFTTHGPRRAGGKGQEEATTQKKKKGGMRPKKISHNLEKT